MPRRLPRPIVIPSLAARTALDGIRPLQALATSAPSLAPLPPGNGGYEPHPVPIGINPLIIPATRHFPQVDEAIHVASGGGMVLVGGVTTVGAARRHFQGGPDLFPTDVPGLPP